MQILAVFRGAFLCFYLLLLFSASFCYGEEKSTVEVVGMGECADCAESNIKASQALSGLRITIDCKLQNGDQLVTRGEGELNEEGKFKVNLPSHLVEDGKLKEQCYAQLHSASAAPCPTHSGLESSKIVFNHKHNEKHTFGLAGKLKISPETCTSAFLWPHFKYPPLAKLPPLHKGKLPLVKDFGYHHHHHKYLFPPKVFPPKVPIYKPPPKVFPPPVPIYKPPPVPIYKPKPKPPIVIKPLPPPVPIYKSKPKPPVYNPPPVPIYKPTPKPPIYSPHPVPIYKPKPPIIYKPLPPIPKIPPFHKKPCPPLPKLPPVPKIPPKYFHHPKFGKKWPPLPPYSPIH